MQILAETEYQDLYRVTDGVLLVVNKFKPIDYSDQTDRHVCLYSPKTGKYYKGCQDGLKILNEDYFDNYANVIVPKGTVVYYNTPVEPVTDASQITYQIKTTGNLFSGNANKMTYMLNEILHRIQSGKCDD